jgi:hypothetical protein
VFGGGNVIGKGASCHHLPDMGHEATLISEKNLLHKVIEI